MQQAKEVGHHVTTGCFAIVSSPSPSVQKPPLAPLSLVPEACCLKKRIPHGGGEPNMSPVGVSLGHLRDPPTGYDMAPKRLLEATLFVGWFARKPKGKPPPVSQTWFRRVRFRSGLPPSRKRACGSLSIVRKGARCDDCTLYDQTEKRNQQTEFGSLPQPNILQCLKCVDLVKCP